MKWLRPRKRLKEPKDNSNNKRERWIFSERDGLFYCSKCNGGMVNNIYPYCPWCGENLRRD